MFDSFMPHFFPLSVKQGYQVFSKVVVRTERIYLKESTEHGARRRREDETTSDCQPHSDWPPTPGSENMAFEAGLQGSSPRLLGCGFS